MNRFVVGLALAIAGVASRDLSALAPSPRRRGRHGPRRGTPWCARAHMGGTRPPVIGSSAGVSAGHPLTSAAGIEILCGRQCVRCRRRRGARRRSRRTGSLQPRWRNARARLPGQGKAGDLDGRPGLGAEGARSNGTNRAARPWTAEGSTLPWCPVRCTARSPCSRRWGTMSFEQVSARAIAYAEQGFPMRPRTARPSQRNLEFFKKWPDNQRYWLKPDGSMYCRARRSSCRRSPTR